MNSFSIIGIFVLPSLVYCAAPKGPVIYGLDVTFENGENYAGDPYPGSSISPLMLLGLPDGGYQVVEFELGEDAPSASSETFDIKGVDTMYGVAVVVRTNKSCFLMETILQWGVLELFDLTTRPKLAGKEPLYTYSVSGVYKYHLGPVLGEASISGYKYETAGNPQERYIIHFGPPAELLPHILWTEGSFNFSPCGPKSVKLTLAIRPTKSYEYFLVEFLNAADFEKWVKTAGQRVSRDIPLPPGEVSEYVPPSDPPSETDQA